MEKLKYKEIEDRVKFNISEYIGFDVHELFLSDYITIYGGAVRDSIAELEIHDVDILCMPHSANKLKSFLLTKGYKQFELYDQDKLNMYQGLSLISEPWTLIKNDKVIQIIRPRWFKDIKSNNINDFRLYEDVYYNLIRNVDISCCGVFLEQDHNNSKLSLKEACENAIIQCLTKTFKINKYASLYNPKRIYDREYKLIDRGWTNFGLSNYQNIKNIDILKIERKHKLTEIDLYFDQEEYKLNHIWVGTSNDLDLIRPIGKKWC